MVTMSIDNVNGIKLQFCDNNYFDSIYLHIQNTVLKHQIIHLFHKKIYDIINKIKGHDDTGIICTGETQVKFLNFRMLLDCEEKHDLYFYKLYKSGKLYEKETSEIFIDNLRNGDTFVDIGANNGYF